MSGLVFEKLKQSLEAADGLYHRLVLLVGETGSGKTAVLHALAEALSVPVINVNLELSTRLLELTVKRRILALPNLFDEITNTGQPVIILDNLEILFGKDLQQDPLRLLQKVSRNRCVVASWNSTATRERLVYAKPGHPEYRLYEMIDTLLVQMDGAATID